ncbi:MAG: hypothetical protein ACYSW1_02360, partial [Planctomycetota bacterium]
MTSRSKKRPRKKTRSKKKAPPKPAASRPAPLKPHRAGATAEAMAAKQREISVSEFFAKNRHLLGF